MRNKLLVRAPHKVISQKGYGWRKPSLAGSFVFSSLIAMTMKCQHCKGEISSKSEYCSHCGQKLKGKYDSQNPKINLLVFTVLSFLSGGIYFPIWFWRRHSFFGYDTDQHRLPILNKWFLVAAMLILMATTVIGGWYSANLRIFEHEFKEQALEHIRAGEDILSVYKDDSELLNKRISLEGNILLTGIVKGIIGMFLIYQAFIARNVINVYLKEAYQKQISRWVWITSGFCFYIIFTLVGSSTDGLLWSNFPLIFWMQYKINRLSEKNNRRR